MTLRICVLLPSVRHVCQPQLWHCELVDSFWEDLKYTIFLYFPLQIGWYAQHWDVMDKVVRKCWFLRSHYWSYILISDVEAAMLCFRPCLSWLTAPARHSKFAVPHYGVQNALNWNLQMCIHKKSNRQDQFHRSTESLYLPEKLIWWGFCVVVWCPISRFS